MLILTVVVVRMVVVVVLTTSSSSRFGCDFSSTGSDISGIRSIIGYS